MLYSICRNLGDGSNNAGYKAPNDINSILESFGVTTHEVFRNQRFPKRLIETMKTGIEFGSKLNENDVLFVQWPLYSSAFITKSCLLSSKSSKIALIHDLDSLRFKPSDLKAQKSELDLLNSFDVVIAHNDRMKDWLVQKGLRSKIITLELFDYLFTPKKGETKSSVEKSGYTINYSGNISKAGFLLHVGDYTKRSFFLCGAKPDFDIPDNIHYRGSYRPDELPNAINESFGLIWDGDSCSGCSGNIGNYTRYNNPHKLSLYMGSGTPVIVWRQAAVADFVEKNGVGVCVDSLVDIDNVLDSIAYSSYERMRENSQRVGALCRVGSYTRKAVLSALNSLK